METLMSILHVGTAVFIVGPMAILPMTGMRALRAGNAGQVRTLARSTTLLSWLSLITFIFGFGLMGVSDPDDNYSFTTPWIIASIILYVIAFVLTLFVVVPRMNKAADDIDGGATGKPSGYGAIAASSGISSLLLVAVVVLMIWRP